MESADWINLAISVGLVFVGYLFGTWLIRRFLPRVLHRAKVTFADRLLETCGDELRWLIVVAVLRYATIRLDFISADLKSFLDHIYFFAALYLIGVIAWRLVNVGADQLRSRAVKNESREGSELIIRWLIWVFRLAVLLLLLTLLFSHFAIEVAGLGILLAVIGIALSLAMRDVLADTVAGIIIIVDRPFGIGDRIELLSLNTSGDVVDIGLRSTRVVTLNNRMVIVPNSQIGKNQVVNYNFPDPSYVDSTQIALAYENDAEKVIQLITETVKAVEGVDTARAVVVLLTELKESRMLFTTSYWVHSYLDTGIVHDRVNRAMMQALKDAGVVFPYSKEDVTVQMALDTAQPE